VIQSRITCWVAIFVSPCSVNPLLLQMAADRRGFTSRYWGTYHQWHDLGGQVVARPANVKPGEWGRDALLRFRLSLLCGRLLFGLTRLRFRQNW
jgi:hypothetical protein